MTTLALKTLLAGMVVVAASSIGAGLLAGEARGYVHVYDILEPPNSSQWAIYLDGDVSAVDLRMYAAKIKRTSSGERQVLVFDSLTQDFQLDGNAHICAYQRSLGKDAGQNRTRIVCSAEDVWKIQIEGTDGDDALCVIEPLKEEFNTFIDAHGHKGDDALSGGSAGDELNGESGNDTIIGYKGPDQLSGFQFAADDELDEYRGIVQHPARDRDLLFGMEGADAIWGGPGADWIVGGAGPDFMLCGTDGFWNQQGNPTVTGCEDRWQRDRGDNKIFAAEPFDRDPVAGLPLSLSPEPDKVNCGGSYTSTPNLAGYDSGLDILSNCPTRGGELQNPPQLTEPHPLARDNERYASCPAPRQP